MTTKLVLAFAIVAGTLTCGFADSASAQGKPGDRQFYSKWRPFKNSKDQYICDYNFKVNPADAGYHLQYVIWIRRKPDLVFYFNAKGKYWCAAPREEKDKWHVFKNKVGRISKMVKLPDLQDPPPIPLTKGTPHQAAMLFPSFDGLPKP